ncbi:MAG: M23 family metallopeptidase, partial [Candidatus Spechtbacterales bacterium]
TPIYAAASGAVGIAVNNGRWNGGYGNYVTMSHPNGTHTLYAHLDYGGVVVSPGQYVSQGQLLGYMGTTGLSSGYHLHWEVHGARHPLAGYGKGTNI